MFVQLHEEAAQCFSKRRECTLNRKRKQNVLSAQQDSYVQKQINTVLACESAHQVLRAAQAVVRYNDLVLGLQHAAVHPAVNCPERMSPKRAQACVKFRYHRVWRAISFSLCKALRDGRVGCFATMCLWEEIGGAPA